MRLSVQDTRLGCLFALPPDGVVKVGRLEPPGLPTLKLFSSLCVENPSKAIHKATNAMCDNHLDSQPDG